MENNFEFKVDEFIKKVKTFDKTKLNRNIFNPWNEFDENDLNNADEIRCANLKRYLLDKKNANYILIAESPSKGARYTGIAMTSEVVIKDYNLPYHYSSLNCKKSKKGESTACKVWREISKSKNTFVMWNAFAFNIHEQKDKWFETPKEEELEANKYILNEFINLYPKAKIVAVGDTAKKALNHLNIEAEGVRHPSNDFNKQFPVQISKFL